MSSISGIGGGFAGANSLREIMELRAQIIEKSQVLQQVHSQQGQASTSATSVGAAPGFSQTLQNALQAVNTSQTRASDLTSAYETGQTQDVAKVMLARQEASVGFEATLQVRNKLLNAYQEIMKMGV
jgi:flagellar hook-basal body complex protein FliE